MRLITLTRGLGFAEHIAQLENEYMLWTGECLERPVDPGRVRFWLEQGDSGPEELALVLEDNLLAGYSWAWVNVDEGPASLAWVMLRVNPLIDRGSQVRAARLLLSWARHSLEHWQEARGVTRVRLGLVEGYTFNLARGLLPVESYRVSGVLMEARGRAPPVRAGVRVREAEPWSSRGDLEAVVRIYNDAFSVYDTYRRWSIDRARSYFEAARRELDLLVLIAEDDGPVGFAEAYIYDSVCGVRVGYVALLAVVRSRQGRGVGSTLLALAADWLRGRGAGRVVLDAVPDAVGLYLRMGFRPVRIYVEAAIPLYLLPAEVYTMEAMDN